MSEQGNETPEHVKQAFMILSQPVYDEFLATFDKGGSKTFSPAYFAINDAQLKVYEYQYLEGFKNKAPYDADRANIEEIVHTTMLKVSGVISHERSVPHKWASFRALYESSKRGEKFSEYEWKKYGVAIETLARYVIMDADVVLSSIEEAQELDTKLLKVATTMTSLEETSDLPAESLASIEKTLVEFATGAMKVKSETDSEGNTSVWVEKGKKPW